MGLRFRTWLIGVCYRPLESPVDFVKKLGEVLDDIHTRYLNTQLMIAGDFNYPGIDWKSRTITPTCSGKSECTTFMGLSNIFQLNQVVKEPKCNESILDLVLTTHSDNALVNVLEHISGHKVVPCQVVVHVDTCDAVQKLISNYAKADNEMVAMLSAFLSVYWDGFDKQSLYENWVVFRDRQTSIERNCVPRIAIAPHTSNPWFTANIKHCLNKKRFYKKAVCYGAEVDSKAYNSHSLQCKEEIKLAKHNLEHFVFKERKDFSGYCIR